jgi:hypothetical protein
VLNLHHDATFLDGLKSIADMTKLFKLPQDPSWNPFVTDASFPRIEDPTAKALLRSLANFSVMRNYAAHHDSRDKELIRDPHFARPALEGLLVTALTGLRAAEIHGSEEGAGSREKCDG